LILGGAQENTLLTCEGLHGLGHEVTLVTGPALGPEGQLLDRARGGGYRVIVLDDLRREISPARDWRAGRDLKRLFLSLGPDVMHSHSSKAGIIARKAAADVRGRLGGIRIVHTVHGLPFHPYQSRMLNALYIHLEKIAARRTDAIICVADAMTRQALAAGIGKPGQYTTIYSGMDITPYLARPAGADAFRQSLDLPPEAVLVTQVSRLAPLKGHQYILEAARRMNQPNVFFCFVGDGTLARRIKRQVAKSGLGGRFRFTGLLDPAMIPGVMHATDILVHCSLREGLARALPQGMLAGKPVISFDVDGAREVVDASTGMLLAPGDVAGLAAGIDRLAADGELRRSLGQAGRQRCAAMFDHGLMVRRICEVYEHAKRN
jgi:glycosyltransferase involved in cell wall biosynthesis